MNASRYIRDGKIPAYRRARTGNPAAFSEACSGRFQAVSADYGRAVFTHVQGTLRALANGITNPDETLVVASSDLSHFHNAERAHVMDRNVAKLISEYDVDGLSDALDSGRSEACGGGPIMAAMLYAKAKGRTDVKVLKYATSADTTGDRSSVVGYLSAVIS